MHIGIIVVYYLLINTAHSFQRKMCAFASAASFDSLFSTAHQ